MFAVGVGTLVGASALPCHVLEPLRLLLELSVTSPEEGDCLERAFQVVAIAVHPRGEVHDLRVSDPNPRQSAFVFLRDWRRRRRVGGDDWATLAGATLGLLDDCRLVWLSTCGDSLVGMLTTGDAEKERCASWVDGVLLLLLRRDDRLRTGGACVSHDCCDLEGLPAYR